MRNFTASPRDKRCGSLAGTRTYQSTVNVSGLAYGGATIIAKPGDPDHSIIYTRMHSSDQKKKMPALGSEVPDVAAISMIRNWCRKTGCAPLPA